MAGKQTQPPKKWRSQKAPLVKLKTNQSRASRSPGSPAKRDPKAKSPDARKPHKTVARARTAREAREDKENQNMERDGEYQPSSPDASSEDASEVPFVESPEPEVYERAHVVSEDPSDKEKNEKHMAPDVSEAPGDSAENDLAIALAAAPEAAKPKGLKAKVTSWKEEPSYKKYKDLSKKPAACPPFEKEKNGDGCVVVTGEVWCRVSGCNFRPSDDCTGALRKHLSKHGLKSAEQVRTGRTKFGEYDGVRQFYQSLMERHNKALELISQVDAARRSAVDDTSSNIEDAPIQVDASVNDNAASGHDRQGDGTMDEADNNDADDPRDLVLARRVRPAGRLVFDGEKLISAGVSGGANALDGKLGDRDLERGFAAAIANLPQVNTPMREIGGARAQARQQEKLSAMIRTTGKGKQTRGFKVTGRATFTLDVGPPSPRSGRSTACLANPISRIDQFVPVGFGANGTPYLRQQMNGALLGNGGMFNAGGQQFSGNVSSQCRGSPASSPQDFGIQTADVGGAGSKFVPHAQPFGPDHFGNPDDDLGQERGRQAIRGQAPQRDYSPLNDSVHITGLDGKLSRAGAQRHQKGLGQCRAQARARSPVEFSAPPGGQGFAHGTKRRRLRQGRRPSCTSPVISPRSQSGPGPQGGAGSRGVSADVASSLFGAQGYRARGIASSALPSINFPKSARARSACRSTAPRSGTGVGRNGPLPPVLPLPSRFSTAAEEEEHVEEVIRYLIPGHTPAPIDGPQGALDEDGNPVLSADLQERIREARREVRSCLVDYDLYLELE